MISKHPYPAIAAGSAEDKLAWLGFEAIRAARAWAERAEREVYDALLPTDRRGQLASLLVTARCGDALDEGFVEAALSLAAEYTSQSRDASRSVGKPDLVTSVWADLWAVASAILEARDLGNAIRHRNRVAARHY